ncbi:hypothetical protein MBLNU459_g0751t1 [Dothideomycetes sp. NU459]
MSAINTGAPVPSKVCFIAQLRELPLGEKVRFVGCVNRYNEQLATLELFHDFPKSRNATASTIHVSVADLIDLVKRDDLEVGAWVNVIGYIHPLPPLPPGTNRRGHREVNQVKAVMLWSAGTINLDEYEKALVERQVT